MKIILSLYYNVNFIITVFHNKIEYLLYTYKIIHLMTTIANSFFGQWVTNELRPFVDRGECSQVAYAITNLVRTQLHDMPAPGCAYGGPDEDYPSVSIDIFWTHPERVSLFINQDGSTALFKYGPDIDNSVGFSFPPGTHQYALDKVRMLLSSADMGVPFPHNTTHFHVVPRGTYAPETAVLVGSDDILSYYDLNTIPEDNDDPVKG